MTAVLIVLIILCLLCVTTSIISIYVAYRALMSFLEKEVEHSQYRQYIGALLEELNQGSFIFRTSLAKKIGMVEEWKDLNSQLVDFENKITAFQLNLKRFLYSEEDE